MTRPDMFSCTSVSPSLQRTAHALLYTRWSQPELGSFAFQLAAAAAAAAAGQANRSLPGLAVLAVRAWRLAPCAHNPRPDSSSCCTEARPPQAAGAVALRPDARARECPADLVGGQVAACGRSHQRRCMAEQRAGQAVQTGEDAVAAPRDAAAALGARYAAPARVAPRRQTDVFPCSPATMSVIT
jgi:hypothetical protein